jgi:hypothetical protein
LKDSADLLAAEFVGDVREGLTDFINPAAGIGVTPMPDLLYFPWSFSVYDDKKKAGYNRSRGIQLNPSLITLTPAPGEYLDLNFTVRGQFMEPTDSTAYIQVVADNEDSQFGVLLEYNGIEYPPSSRIPFSPTHPLFGLRLHGLEGATGRLVVSTTSQILVEELTVSIPFVLAGCPFGFYSPIATDWKNVSQYFKITQPQQVAMGSQPSPLTCNCYNLKKSHQDTVISCKNGKTATMYNFQWLGNPYDVEKKKISDLCSLSLIDWDTSRVNFQCYNESPSSVLITKEEYALADCVLNFCKDSGSGMWTEIEGPCMEHRKGPLCGQCEEGYTVTPSSLKCVKCGNHEWVIIFVTLICGLLLVLAAVLLNLKLSPIPGAILFFTQMAAILTDVDSNAYIIVHLVNLDFTFGLCYSPKLTAMKRLAMHFFPPLYVLTLVIFFVLASRLNFFSHCLNRRSCLYGVWTIILLSYFSLSNVAFGFLNCVSMRSMGTSKIYRRFLDDPSVSCYQGSHLIWLIISCITVVLILLPFPIAILFLRRSTRLQPFADVCYSLYKDSHWWWGSFDLMRRLAFSAINAFVPAQDDQTLKCSLLIGLSILVLLIHSVGAPFRSKLENVFESLVLFDLCCLAIIAANGNVTHITVYLPSLIYLPWACGLIVVIYIKRDTVLQKCGRFWKGYQMIKADDSLLSLNKIDDSNDEDENDNNNLDNRNDSNDKDDDMVASHKQSEESGSLWGNLSLEPGLRDPLLDDHI